MPSPRRRGFGGDRKGAERNGLHAGPSGRNKAKTQ